MTEVGWQKTDAGRQKTDGRRQKTDDSGLKTEWGVSDLASRENGFDEEWGAT